MPAFGGLTGWVYRKAWRVPAPRAAAVVFLHGFGKPSGLYRRLRNALNGVGIDCGRSTRSATGSPRATPASAEHGSSSPEINRLNSCPAATCST
jgi:hypothetical protein